MTQNQFTLPPSTYKREKMKTSLESIGMTENLPWSDAGILREFAGILGGFAGIPASGAFSRKIPASKTLGFSVIARDLSE